MNFDVKPNETDKSKENSGVKIDFDKRIDTKTNKEGTDSAQFNPDKRVVIDNKIKEDRTNEIGNSDNHFPNDTPENEYKEGNALKPNAEFMSRGYEYKTDSKGRIISAEGKLRLKEEGRSRSDMAPMKDVGKGDEKENDQRGHLIAYQFDGSNGNENLVAMDGYANQIAYAKIENTLANAVKDGCDAKLKVDVKYSGDSNRPTSFRVSYTIDGKKEIVTVKNGSEQTR